MHSTQCNPFWSHDLWYAFLIIDILWRGLVMWSFDFFYICSKKYVELTVQLPIISVTTTPCDSHFMQIIMLMTIVLKLETFLPKVLYVARWKFTPCATRSSADMILTVWFNSFAYPEGRWQHRHLLIVDHHDLHTGATLPGEQPCTILGVKSNMCSLITDEQKYIKPSSIGLQPRKLQDVEIFRKVPWMPTWHPGTKPL